MELIGGEAPGLGVGLSSARTRLEKNKKIDTTARPLQRRYNQLNSIGLTAIFIFVCNSFEKQIIANLKSKHPSIILFDLYKLCFYCKLKKNA